MRDVQVGDVLTNGKTDRVVREVHRYGNEPRKGRRYREGDLFTVTFVIRHCSWTHRAYTILSYVDLIQFCYRPKNVRVSLRTKLDRQIAHDIAYENRASEDQILDCCDVRGVA